MALYTNPYSGDDTASDPAAQRRRAILDMMDPQGGTYRGTAATPAFDPGAGGGQPGGDARPTATSDSTAGSPPSTTQPAGQPPGFTSTDDGRHFGNQILGLYDDPYTRRNTYGGSDPRRQAIASALVSSGNPYAMAAGAVGYLDAYLHRHADSAPTDFSVDDATQIIRQAYRDMHGGQEISDQELNDALTGQGLRSGSHWVGQAGLEGVLGHLAENAAATGGMNPAAATAGAGGTTAAGGAGTAGATGATPGGALANNPNTGFNGGASTSVSGPSGSTGGGGGGVPANIEGVDAGKWNDPNKHDPKYDVLHMIASAGSLDAAWPQIQQAFPGATRVSQDVVDFGGDIGKVDLQRDSENNGGYHWEPVDSGADQSAAGAAPVGVTPSPVTTPGAAQLAAPLTNNAVLQQIMDEVRRIQSGQPPRNAILQQMGVA